MLDMKAGSISLLNVEGRSGGGVVSLMNVEAGSGGGVVLLLNVEAGSGGGVVLLLNVEAGSGGGVVSLLQLPSTLLRIYLNCIRPHLEYACQLWDPYTDKGTQALESVQKFACKVCLKQWDIDYESMLQQLELTSLSQRRNFLKLTTMYNIINGTFATF